MTPAPSWLGTDSGEELAELPDPRRDFQSVGLTPETRTRTRTSPGPGSRTGRSTRRRTSGPPVSEYTTALTIERSFHHSRQRVARSAIERSAAPPMPHGAQADEAERRQRVREA